MTSPHLHQGSSEPIEAARAAVMRSDMAQSDSLGVTTQAETVALRDALRALIQWAEAVEQGGTQ